MISKIIDDFINSTENRPNIDKFRVSDSGKCRLMRYWKRFNIPPSDPFDNRSKRIFEVGHLFHRWIQNILRDKGYLINEEIEVLDTHRVGHIDAVVEIDRQIILYEFKTVNSKKFQYFNKLDDIHHAQQAYTYSLLLDIPIDDIRIVYISKDDLLIEEISVFNYPNIQQTTLEDWNILLSCWIENTPPNPNPKSWECKYCNYKTFCNQNKN